MYSYFIVGIAVVMFAFVFFFNSLYEKNSGGSLRAIITFSLGSYTTGFLILLAINKFKLEATPFSLAVAAVAATNLLLFNFCSIKSFGKINLSLYSVFSMLGGMALPFIAGILFFGEKLTVGKIICFITIAAALALTIEKGKTKGGLIYYAGIFVFNGMSGVISKFYQSAKFPKTTEAAYSVQIAAIVVIVCIILLLFNKDEKLNINVKSIISIIGNGTLGNVGNFLLLLGLTQIPASAQYPFVTGGVMIVSTIICYFTPNKPKKRELGAVALSFIGILALCVLG